VEIMIVVLCIAAAFYAWSRSRMSTHLLRFQIYVLSKSITESLHRTEENCRQMEGNNEPPDMG